MIVAFHRVDDRARGNPVGCGVDELRRYLDFFARHFRVVALPERLDRMEDGRGPGRLAITCDDGYLDNVRIAAPELRARGLPATKGRAIRERELGAPVTLVSDPRGAPHRMTAENSAGGGGLPPLPDLSPAHLGFELLFRPPGNHRPECRRENPGPGRRRTHPLPPWIRA